jgi:hypothetical protein
LEQKQGRALQWLSPAARRRAGHFVCFYDQPMSQTSSPKHCAMCGKIIPAARLEALPGVTTCIECAKKYPRKVDTSGVELSQASPINRNGFAPKD